MDIKTLLENSRKVKSYGSKNFKSKKFGTIYATNKTVKVKPKHSIIEVSMMIKGVTDKTPSGRGQYKAVAAHNVKVAIHGVNQEALKGDELVQRIRESNDKYADKKKYPKKDLLKMAVEHRVKFFEGKTIFKSDNPDEYVIMEDKVSDENKIRVWCSCSSFHWAFLYYDVNENACIRTSLGKNANKVYQHKTLKGYEAFKRNHPLRNPDKLPGACKHIVLLLAMLMNEEVVEAKNKATVDIQREYTVNVKKFLKTETLSKEGYDNLMKEYRKDYNRQKELRDRNMASFNPSFSKKKKNKMWKGWNKKKGSFG